MIPCQNQTQDTLVGGKHSHHCAIPAPLTYPMLHNYLDCYQNYEIKLCSSHYGSV